MKTIRLMALGLILVFMPTWLGCPDYSHQRSVPDYKNMADDGEQGHEDEKEEDE